MKRKLEKVTSSSQAPPETKRRKVDSHRPADSIIDFVREEVSGSFVHIPFPHPSSRQKRFLQDQDISLISSQKKNRNHWLHGFGSNLGQMLFHVAHSIMVTRTLTKLALSLTTLETFLKNLIFCCRGWPATLKVSFLTRLLSMVHFYILFLPCSFQSMNQDKESPSMSINQKSLEIPLRAWGLSSLSLLCLTPAFCLTAQWFFRNWKRKKRKVHPVHETYPPQPSEKILARKSLLVLTDESRYNWTHEISKSKSYRMYGARHKRQTRISITFRVVI